MTGSSNISLGSVLWWDCRCVERLWPKIDPLPAELPIITHHIRHLEASSAPSCCAATQGRPALCLIPIHSDDSSPYSEPVSSHDCAALSSS